MILNLRNINIPLVSCNDLSNHIDQSSTRLWAHEMAGMHMVSTTTVTVTQCNKRSCDKWAQEKNLTPGRCLHTRDFMKAVNKVMQWLASVIF